MESLLLMAFHKGCKFTYANTGSEVKDLEKIEEILLMFAQVDLFMKFIKNLQIDSSVKHEDSKRINTAFGH